MILFQLTQWFLSPHCFLISLIFLGEAAWLFQHLLLHTRWLLLGLEKVVTETTLLWLRFLAFFLIIIESHGDAGCYFGANLNLVIIFKRILVQLCLAIVRIMDWINLLYLTILSKTEALLKPASTWIKSLQPSRLQPHLHPSWLRTSQIKLIHKLIRTNLLSRLLLWRHLLSRIQYIFFFLYNLLRFLLILVNINPNTIFVLEILNLIDISFIFFLLRIFGGLLRITFITVLLAII